MADLSVIIPTANRSGLLAKTLQSLLQCSGCRGYDVIVVDNGSTDDTAAVVESFRNRFSQLRYFYDATPGLHTGRHIGMREAQTDILSFLDDDVVVMPTWSTAVLLAFETPDVAMVGGKNLPEFECDPPQWLMEFWQENRRGERKFGPLSIIDLGNEVKEINPKMIWGCNFSIRKSVLEAAGGFHPDSMPEELIHLRGDGETYVSEYVSGAGLKAVYHPMASVYHYVPKSRMTHAYLQRRYFNQGISDSFTHLRQFNGDLAAASKNLDQRVKQFWQGRRPTESMDPYYLQQKLNAAYISGYMYHLSVVKDSAEVREWVLRENYVGDALRQPCAAV